MFRYLRILSGIFLTVFWLGLSIQWIFNVPFTLIIFDPITDKIVGLMIFIGAIYEGMKTYYVAYEEQA